MESQHSVGIFQSCDLCKLQVKLGYCSKCQISLCKACVGEHLSDQTTQHQVAGYTFVNCIKHVNKHGDVYCKTCDITICVQCAISTEHQNHDKEESLETFNDRKKVLQNELEELEENIYLKYKGRISSLELEINTLDKVYEKLTSDIIQQGIKWHREIDNLIDQLKAELANIKHKHLAVIKEHEDVVKYIMSELEKCIEELKILIELKDMPPVLAHKSRNASFRVLPPNLKVCPPIFYPKELDSAKLLQEFGYLSSLTITTEKCKEKAAETKSFLPATTLLDEPELRTSINTNYVCHSVVCQSDDKIWISSNYQNTLKLLDLQGSLLKQIQTKSGNGAVDIAVTGRGDLVYTDSTTKTINIVEEKIIKEVIRLSGWRPSNICCTTSDDFLIVMYNDDFTQSKVVRYSGSEEKQTIQYDDEGNSLFSMRDTKYICENRNLDICVADREACAITVVNKSGDLRFRYAGPYFTIKQKPFEPRGITTDSNSHILTADHSNECIHILDQDGQFLHYIENCRLCTPWGLCVDTAGYLIVSESSNCTVKRIKYR